MDISLDKVCFLIYKVHELDVKVPPGADNEGSNPTDDMDLSILEDREDDLTSDEVHDFFDGLNEDETLDLVALTWIGRGTYSPDEWDTAREIAAQEATNATSEYLLGTPLLADYLQDGLDAMGFSCEDMEIGRL